MIITTPYTQANCYVTYDDAVMYLNERLFVDAWTNASSTPNAINYVVNGTVNPGSLTIPIRDGTGIFTAGNFITINGARYQLRSATNENSTSLELLTGPASTIADGSVILRETNNVRESALIWATNIIDNSFEWYGYKNSSEQTLRWPRANVPDPDGFIYSNESVPDIVQRATAELAMHLMQRDLSKLPTVIGTGLKTTTMPGPFQAGVDIKNVASIVPPYIRNMLMNLGDPVTPMGGISIVKLQRS